MKRSRSGVSPTNNAATHPRLRRGALSRRALLRGTAGSVIALPFLEALAPWRVLAQAAPPRFIAFPTVLGTFPERFWPRKPGQGPFPKDYRSKGKDYRTGSNFMDSTEFELGEICEPLQAHKKDLIFIENLLNTEDSHEDYKGLLTGHKSRGDDKINFVNITESEGMSVDQILARRFGKDTPYSTLHFSYNNKGTGKYDALSFLPGSQPVPAIPDPAQMFDKLFGDFTFGENPEKQAQLGRLRAQRRSILDAALGQISRIKKQVSTLDQSKLDQYFQSLREVEKSLSSEEMTTVGCEKPPFAPPRNGTWFPSEDDDGQAPKILKAQMDMLVLAMSCDLTRYATLRIGHEGTNARYRFLNVERGHHDLSHVEPDKPDAIERYEEITRINRWNAEQLAYLVGKLKSTPAPEGGTLFDSMLIVWVNGLSLGYQHTSRNKPTVLIGSAGGRIRTGRHLRFPTPGNNQPARTYSDMYCALLNKFGISMPRFGDPKYFNGALNELVT